MEMEIAVLIPPVGNPQLFEGLINKFNDVSHFHSESSFAHFIALNKHDFKTFCDVCVGIANETKERPKFYLLSTPVVLADNDDGFHQWLDKASPQKPWW